MISSFSSLQSTDKNQHQWFYVLLSAFGLLAAATLVEGIPYTLLVPVAIAFFMIAVFHLEWLVFFTVFVTPLSINLAKTGLGIGVSLPAEPLMFALFLVFWLKIFADGGLDRKIFTHPVTVSIFLYLAWMTLTTISSTMFIVSLKSLLARYCYISVFYFMILHMFRNFKNVYRFIWYYIFTLLIVIVYTIITHSHSGFTEKAAHIAMVPFYNDHTAYAAAISFSLVAVFS